MFKTSRQFAVAAATALGTIALSTIAAAEEPEVSPALDLDGVCHDHSTGQLLRYGDELTEEQTQSAVNFLRQRLSFLRYSELDLLFDDVSSVTMGEARLRESCIILSDHETEGALSTIVPTDPYFDQDTDSLMIYSFLNPEEWTHFLSQDRAIIRQYAFDNAITVVNALANTREEVFSDTDQAARESRNNEARAHLAFFLAAQRERVCNGGWLVRAPVICTKVLAHLDGFSSTLSVEHANNAPLYTLALTRALNGRLDAQDMAHFTDDILNAEDRSDESFPSPYDADRASLEISR